jgi:precorrin-6Y C5,15-methyltransferase (decarboxylating) CbiT subunit
MLGGSRCCGWRKKRKWATLVSDISINRRGVVADEWFERAERVPMTKGAVRSVLLSVLSPLAGASVLEIGSGSGAMTVELARAVGASGRVTSIEISAAAAALARLNLTRAGFAERVALIEGSAPGVVPDESFDAAFIGGHGKELEAIMERCLGLINSGGRLVLTSITPRTTSRALEYLENAGTGVGFWRLHSSSGRKAGGDWLLIGDNPIDIIWGDK